MNSDMALALTVSATQSSATSCSLSSGWNLIGLKSNEVKSITNLISENENNIASIWKWEDNNWYVYLPKDGLEATKVYVNSKGFSVLLNIEPGEGFWVNATQNLILP
ncbi:MAG: hypothetical protein U9R02_10210 [Thermodesulfobacteriota bacterium]|nr:hypothetical protein [Thermodesulfobacteriota bacterium]